MKRDHTSVEVMLKYNDSLIESVFDWCLDTFGEDGFLLDRIRVPPHQWAGNPYDEVIRCATSDTNAVMFLLRWNEYRF